MALIAEAVVEEWLNRQGYFTIRGLKKGNDEIDLLALRVIGNKIERIHFEVQVSIKPVSYISGLSKELQTEFKIMGSRNASKRNSGQMKKSVNEWVEKKYKSRKKE